MLFGLDRLVILGCAYKCPEKMIELLTLLGKGKDEAVNMTTRLISDAVSKEDRYSELDSVIEYVENQLKKREIIGYNGLMEDLASELNLSPYSAYGKIFDEYSKKYLKLNPIEEQYARSISAVIDILKNEEKLKQKYGKIKVKEAKNIVTNKNNKKLIKTLGKGLLVTSPFLIGYGIFKYKDKNKDKNKIV